MALTHFHYRGPNTLPHRNPNSPPLRALPPTSFFPGALTPFLLGALTPFLLEALTPLPLGLYPYPFYLKGLNSFPPTHVGPNPFTLAALTDRALLPLFLPPRGTNSIHSRAQTPFPIGALSQYDNNTVRQ